MEYSNLLKTPHSLCVRVHTYVCVCVCVCACVSHTVSHLEFGEGVPIPATPTHCHMCGVSPYLVTRIVISENILKKIINNF